MAMMRASGALPIRRACATMAPAMPVPWTCGPSALPSVEMIGDGIGEFGMLGVDAGVDHGNRDVGSVRQRMRLRQAEFCQRILRGIALDRYGRFLVLEHVAEVRLGGAHAAVGRELAPYRLGRPAVGDAEQAERRPDQRKILGCDAREAVATRKLIGLRHRQTAVDLGDEFVGKAALVHRDRRVVAAPLAGALLVARFSTALAARVRLCQAFAVGSPIGRRAGRIEVGE